MKFLDTHIPKSLIVLNGIMGVAYFIGILTLFTIGDRTLFWIFVTGEIFHVWQLFTYLHTIWDMDHVAPFRKDHTPAVDIFITVAGEPIDVVRETVVAAKAMRYPNHHIYILNDGFVAGKQDWRDVKKLAKSEGVRCITRRKPGGAKAGNINHALRMTQSPFIAIFDADHVPHPDFLAKTMGYFGDDMMGFVQTPQYYGNHMTNAVTAGAWEQQEIFFGPIMKGKNRLNAAFMCGTNMVLRRRALEGVGGMCETNIAEDFLTSLFIHEKGWRSYYVPEVLAEGLSPEDFLSYHKQQFRWARGSLEVIFRYNPLLRSGLTISQKIQYLASSSFYLSGPVVLLNALLPVVFFLTGKVVFDISTMVLAGIFIPYLCLTLYVLSLSSNSNYTFRALAFAMGSFAIHTKALFSVLTGRKVDFQVTSKTEVEGNFLYLVAPHIGYIILVALSALYAIHHVGATDSVLTNIAWGGLYAAIFIPFIRAAWPSHTRIPFLARTYAAWQRSFGTREGAEIEGISYDDERV